VAGLLVMCVCLDVSPNWSDECHDRNPVKEKPMSENAIDSTKATQEPAAAKPKRKPGKKAKPANKAGRAKKPAAKPKADRANKKAEVIAMMKRAKGATLPEIMKATDWQAHTVRGFVSILGSKGGEKIESSKNAAGEPTYKIGK
jgi:cell division septation protein DedD